jgi:hypothetical protein
MFYTTDADASRAFIRDKLRLPAHDVGDGWLIFDAPEVEVGCHPSERVSHGISLYCDDIEATMAELTVRGVEFSSPVKDAGYGLITTFEIPGAGTVELYEPKYKKS